MNQTQKAKWCYVPLGIAAIVLLASSGCPNQLSKERAERAAIAAKLETIDTVQLADRSRSTPVTVEQGTAHAAQDVNEPNEPSRTVALTLERVRAEVLANNLDLKIDLVDPAISRRLLDKERAKFESTFYGSAIFDRAEEVGTGDVTKTTSYGVSVKKPLPTGGTIEVGLPFDVTDYGEYDLAEASASVSYVQSLLRGAGTKINTHSIRIAAHEWNIVSARTKLVAIQLLAGADVTYWRLYAARKELDVRREQYKLAQDQLSHARKKVAAGSAPKIEIVRAEAGLSSRLEAVINAETAVQDWARELRRIMNDKDLPLESTLDVVPQTEPNPLGLDLDAEELARQALANRMEMAELEQQLTVDDLRVELAHNATLSDVVFSYSYSTETANGSVGDALRDLTRDRYDEHTVGLSAVIPLGNRAAKADLQKARLTRTQDHIYREKLEQLIRQDVYQAASDLDKNWRRILAAEQGVTAAYRDYRVEQSQFQLGRRTSTDVLLAAARLADAQLTRIRAFADYEVAQINLARATGTLLGHDRVCLQPIDLAADN
jgi:outer membrane protein